MTKKIFKTIILAAAIISMIGCESKIVAPAKNGTSLSFTVDISDASPKLMAIVDSFQVIVVDPSVPETLVVSPLTLSPGGFLVGQIDSLPAEISLEFTAEALDPQLGVIFRGTAIVVLEPEIINEVFISLSPVVPMMKFTPHYIDIIGTDTSAHTFEVKIFNIDSLYGVSFRVRYDPNYLIAINATLDASQNPSSVIFFQADSADAFGSYKAITVTETDSTNANAIVDTDGDGVLCNIRFVLERPFTLADSTLLQIQPTGLTHQNGTFLSTAIYTEDAFVRISP
ncbi:MAG: hypothetical protein ACREBV_01345 [Candidatus Zixiibacteriota bacterium]